MSVAIAQAQEIMGDNFFGLSEIIKYGFGVPPDALYSGVPFCAETLSACKYTHVLSPGAPLSLNEIRMLADADRKFRGAGSYNHEPFANQRRVESRWYLLRRGPMPGSCGMTYKQQTTLLTKEDEVPFACEVAFMVILYWRVRSERLLERVFVRCRDTDSDGDHALVGRVVSGGFNVGDYRDGHCYAYLGLASSVPPRKS